MIDANKLLKVVRYCVTIPFTARGWEVRAVEVDADGKEYNGPILRKTTSKKEANRIKAELNAELKESA